MVGSRVIARFAAKEPGRGGEWYVLEKRGTVVKDFLLTVGNQSLFRVEHDDGSFNNCWNDQLEVIEDD